MTELNVEWAVDQLNRFVTAVDASQAVLPALPPDPVAASLRRRMEATAVSAEKILDQVMPAWRGQVKTGFTDNQWSQRREFAIRAVEELERSAEFAANLGDDAPQLDAGQMHPWVWEGARPLWMSGHFREAVRAASVVVNARTQEKVNRRDLSEADLFKQAFTLDDPKPGKPRLRAAENDGSKSYASLHRGIAAFAEGCYAAIRNPSSHDVLTELGEPEALEQLAVFSTLARWVDLAHVEESNE
ncbi:hypothetical protein CH254_04760 [Rhodococcus sp. 06-412-2C]|uniref:TIGR02391 family protein n=1 Tax=unclassified Rhodococcus (in: high G+C Gram-positive bacteria) TaxID=192944 RepID=UPI000B9B0427|nr:MULTISPECIES: TIGR02391 family protein [unclassified Rhodococcus (in: high G+C Gram-positive bacteria)]OZC91792.1 hypothetical protein CH254_04760 [Rhodococcus sp. 06-412-2C]OZC92360.1 hypothetical protein CH279_26035 [Rhodococcus sp. 06-412-2B]